MSVDLVRRSVLPVLPIINERFSPRAFSERVVTDEELELVLEAARWAPSSMNEQPWRFRYALRGEAGYEAMLASLNPSNQLWADKAPVLMLNLVHRTLSRNGQENYHARHDLGLATAQLTAQATELGMGLHILGGFNAEMVRTAFEIPDTYDIVSVIALGFPAGPEGLPEHLKQRELQHSPRRPLSELVHYGRFNG